MNKKGICLTQPPSLQIDARNGSVCYRPQLFYRIDQAHQHNQALLLYSIANNQYNTGKKLGRLLQKTHCRCIYKS